MLRYAYLWRAEFVREQEEGRKDRPCAVVLAAPKATGGTQVYLLPITHTPPDAATSAIEIPPKVKLHLGLDHERSWIVLDEINDFLWPGFDLRPVPGSNPPRITYGVLPPRFFDRVKTAFLELAKARRVKRTPRE
ncbi:MAG: growth inhibitor PemK [Caulobacteraceae bacterium]|nr:growth inhibitor PemK [Caulobacteraceae bacterium]